MPRVELAQPGPSQNNQSVPIKSKRGSSIVVSVECDLWWLVVVVVVVRRLRGYKNVDKSLKLDEYVRKYKALRFGDLRRPLRSLRKKSTSNYAKRTELHD